MDPFWKFVRREASATGSWNIELASLVYGFCDRAVNVFDISVRFRDGS